jgi:hypothetical protein
LKLTDDAGRQLDAKISVNLIEAEFSVTFESRGGGRNTDYIPAFAAVLRRLAKLSALITSAQVVSKEALRLPADLRNIIPDTCKFPLILSPRTNTNLLATRLRAAAAQVGRAAGSKGPGNPTKKVEIRFMLPEIPADAHAWLANLLASSSGGHAVGRSKKATARKKPGKSKTRR